MSWKTSLEDLFLVKPRGLFSRVRLTLYRLLGLKAGKGNRMEGGGRVRRAAQIEIGSYNAFTQGCWLWPENTNHDGVRIRIGSNNYFNRNLMVDACGLIEIGDDNMFGPDIYMTDSNHTYGVGLTPSREPMSKGHIKIGNRCWVGAKVVILKDVELGDGCVVAAGAVVTRSFPADSVVAGVPARLIKRLEPMHERPYSRLPAGADGNHF